MSVCLSFDKSLATRSRERHDREHDRSAPSASIRWSTSNNRPHLAGLGAGWPPEQRRRHLIERGHEGEQHAGQDRRQGERQDDLAHVCRRLAPSVQAASSSTAGQLMPCRQDDEAAR
jgi:hypothetical protein